MSRVTKSKRALRHSSISSSSPSSASNPSSSQEKFFSSGPSSSPNYKQALLSIGLNERKTCQQCGMSFLKNVQSDSKLHAKYHQRCLKGREWNIKWGDKIVTISDSEYIVQIDPIKPAETNAALDLLEIVNRDLNAPDDNDFWLDTGTLPNGKVYIYVKDGFGIGIITVEKKNSGNWFSIEHGKIVGDKMINLIAGISRIYVCQNQRRSNIGTKLLQTIQKSFIYGLTIPKQMIGWSQPSSSGSKLAASFNGVKHKSGKILIPVYT